MTKEKIDRINFLAKKSKTPEGLTPEEKEEQKILRQEYIDGFRRNLISTLECIDVQNPDGSIEPLIKH